VRKETAFPGWETGQNTLVLQERSTTTIARQRYRSGRNLGSGWNVSALGIRPEIGKLIETIAAVAVVPVSEEHLVYGIVHRVLLVSHLLHHVGFFIAHDKHSNSRPSISNSRDPTPKSASSRQADKRDVYWNNQSSGSRDETEAHDRRKHLDGKIVFFVVSLISLIAYRTPLTNTLEQPLCDLSFIILD
jgi:hypothetical protein